MKNKKRLRIPPSAKGMSDLALSLTRSIVALKEHFTITPLSFHDAQAKHKGVEQKVQRRARVLKLLRERDPELYAETTTRIQEMTQ